jgi:hypothetical protein
LVVLVLVTAACAAPAERRTTATCAGPDPTPLPQQAATAREDLPSALGSPDGPGLPPPVVDPAELLSGGPPPDGIPSIDDPKFEPACAVDWLDDREPVLALEIDGESRAYPAQILIWHEIVNDTIASVPVAVTYCPLCNSALAFDRRLEDRILEFGTSGMLYRSALVMYDRQTESLWSHFTGEAIAGVLTGSSLEGFAVSTISFSDFRKVNPEGWVLSNETGFDRSYGTNPYEGYDDPSSTPFLFSGEIDDSLPPKERVVGIRMGGESVAIVTRTLAERRVITLEVGGQRLVVFFQPGVASALDSHDTKSGKDVGATGVFRTRIQGHNLYFEAAGDGFRDRQTLSEWNILGHAVAGRFTGEKLDPVEHIDTFWFAWAAFQPETEIVAGQQRDEGR